MTDEERIVAQQNAKTSLGAISESCAFPPVTSENMLKQSRREGWQYQVHPVRFLRGKDHA